MVSGMYTYESVCTGMYWYVLFCTGMYQVRTSMYQYVLVCTIIEHLSVGRCLALFGDDIVPAVLCRYAQVLQRPDLINSKGKPLVTTARLDAVWKRLSDRFSTVAADTCMITMSTNHHVHQVRCPLPLDFY